MNEFHGTFALIYLASCVLAASGVFIRMHSRLSRGRDLLATALVVPLTLAYFVGMYRSAGMDYDTYSAAYQGEGLVIPDPGYTALTWLTATVGLSFSSFLLLQGAITLGALWFVAKEKKADAVVVVAVYLMHLAIVRDMSQSRIGLAVAIYLLGQTSRQPIVRALLYLFSASVHITVVVLMFVWTYARLLSELPRAYQPWLLYIPLAMFTIFGTALLNMATAVDPRIQLYLSWDEAAYGAPLESWGGLARTGLLIAIYVAANRRIRGLHLKPYIVTELAAAAILIGLSQFSIFAARLSNVAISMYPIGLGVVALAYQSRVPSRRTLTANFVAKGALVATIAVLLLRPGSYDVLAEVTPVAFRWVSD
ncbi:MAG TPA: EpsG family protein [Caldimonas sp.]|jgi:hypothetical protein|nr:EpsG family protein [Caldimonas sp.]HEX2542310.1 EpsG family protein [Caldimonas sp.]